MAPGTVGGPSFAVTTILFGVAAAHIGINRRRNPELVLPGLRSPPSTADVILRSATDVALKARS